MRDVTARYASDWCRSARRHRVSEGWWEESLCPYQSHDLMETMQENEDIMGEWIVTVSSRSVEDTVVLFLQPS